MGRKATIFKVYEGNTQVFEGTAIEISTMYAMSLKSVWRYAIEKKLVLEKYLIVNTSDKKGTYIANGVRKGRTSEDTDKKRIDVGKVGALYRANWSIEKIADEFIAKPQTIREILEDASFTKLNRDM